MAIDQSELNQLQENSILDNLYSLIRGLRRDVSQLSEKNKKQEEEIAVLKKDIEDKDKKIKQLEDVAGNKNEYIQNLIKQLGSKYKIGDGVQCIYYDEVQRGEDYTNIRRVGEGKIVSVELGHSQFYRRSIFELSPIKDEYFWIYQMNINSVVYNVPEDDIIK